MRESSAAAGLFDLLELTEDRPEPSADLQLPLLMLLGAVQSLRERSTRRLPEEYLRALVEPAPAPLHDELQRAIADLETRVQALPTGPERAPTLQAVLEELARRLLVAAERLFILDTQQSTLSLLEPAERDRYLIFAWDPRDFPGGPEGPNERRAESMFNALTRLRPERRANQGDTAAVRANEFDEAMQRRLTAALVTIPGTRGLRLHRDASASFVQLRAAAAGEGVTLSIGNSYRPLARAQASAARAGNSLAVASFSSHTLGLAVDLEMSHSGVRFSEASTRPFQNLVDMYRSPVHKWMFLRGENHGWYPYRREPWHWEYNPPGFRERLRAPRSETTTVPAAAREAEDINDPIRPPRPVLAIRGAVGRGGRNAAADVLAVQNRLVELRALDQTDATAERPAAPGTVAETSLAKTIEAIESFQRLMVHTVSGRVDTRGPTRTDLDRAIAQPTAAELSAVTNERNGLAQTVSRGVTLTGPVGATAGNAPEDVRAVQRRLVELGRLPASHRESPPAGAAGAVPQANLRSTIAALRAFQKDVDFWLARGTLTGAIAPGVAAPGDPTATLLDRVSAYVTPAASGGITFHDHVVSRATRSDAGVLFAGTASPSAIPTASYERLGLPRSQAAALQLVSTFEGNFDAINTYDRALVSAGFIQFAGSRGLPPYLALLKSRQPAKFRDLLQKYGIDVEFRSVRGGVDAARVVVVDPAGATVLRGAAAEGAIRDDKRLTAALVLSGRDRDVQLVQIEAAIRDYVRPILAAVVSWGARSRNRLGEILRSQKGTAALVDRAIQEGVLAARQRFERVVQQVVRSGAALSSLTDLQTREGDVLAELERDLQAAADVVDRLAQVRSSLAAMIAGASAAGATVSAVLARPELATARQALASARSGLPGIVYVTHASNVTVDATLAAMASRLAAEDTRLALTPSPADTATLVRMLTASRQALGGVAGTLSAAPIFLARIQRIRRSTLDAGLGEAAA